jgi:hypothetical protein
MTGLAGWFLEILKNGFYTSGPIEADVHCGAFYGRFPSLSTWARVKKILY